MIRMPMCAHEICLCKFGVLGLVWCSKTVVKFICLPLYDGLFVAHTSSKTLAGLVPDPSASEVEWFIHCLEAVERGCSCM